MGSCQRKSGGSAGVVDADVEEFYACGGERADDAARVAGDVGHFGAGGFAAEAIVERLGERDGAGDERGIHQLGLPAERNGVPGDEVGRDGLLHLFALIGGGLLEIFVEKPGAGGPGVVGAIGVFVFVFVAVELLGGGDGFREKFIEVAVDDVGLGIDEAGVEMAFEDDEDSFDFGGRCGCGRGRSLQELCWIEWRRVGDPCCAACG